MNLQESLTVVMQQQDLIGKRFYEVFFERCPQAVDHFAGIDMERQAYVVTMALIIVEQLHTKGFTATQHYLRYLGTRHNDRSIPQELYLSWRDAMLKTLESTHEEQWGTDLAEQWQEAIDAAIGLMFDGYETRVTV